MSSGGALRLDGIETVVEDAVVPSIDSGSLPNESRYELNLAVDRDCSD